MVPAQDRKLRVYLFCVMVNFMCQLDRATRCPVTQSLWVCLRACFWKRLAWEVGIGEQAEQMASPVGVGLLPSFEGLKKTKRQRG